MSRLLTMTEVADRLSVSPDTVARMCDRGMIGFIAIKTSPTGRNVRRRIPEAMLERYINENLVASDGAA